MGGDTPGIVNLDTVVQKVLVDIEQYSTHGYRRLLEFATDGYRDLNLYVTDNVKTEYLPINKNLTVDLPPDYAYYTKIGISINGKIWILSLNEDLAHPRATDECGDTIASAVECSPLEESSFFPTWGFYFANHFRNGQYVGEMFGIGGGFNEAEYKIDLQKRQIILSSNLVGDTVILEYKSTGISADGCTVIPVQAVPVIKEYVHWKRLEYNEDKAMNLKRRREEQYYIEYEKFQMLDVSFTMQEYLDHTYRETQSNPKR